MPRKERWLVFFLAALPLVLAGWLLAKGVRLTKEDGFYYFGIARSLARGSGSSFDGIHPTNGYHPLWLICLTPVFWIASDPDKALVLGTLVQAVFLAVGMVLLYGLARRMFGIGPAALTALVWLAFAWKDGLSGLEYSVHALCLLAAAGWWAEQSGRQKPGSPGEMLVPGLLLGLTFLARLDTLLLTPVLLCFLARRECRSGWSRESGARLMALGLPVMGIGLAYVSVNLLAFGHVFPISSAVKQAWSRALLEHDPVYVTHGWWLAKGYQLLWPLRGIRSAYPVALGVVVLPAMLLVRALVRAGICRGWRSGVTAPLEWCAPFAVYSVLQFGLTALLYHGDLVEKPWYYAVQPWLAALLVGSVVQQVLSRLDRWPAIARHFLPAGLCVLVLCQIAGAARAWEARQRTGQIHDPLYDAAIWARTHLPPDAIVGTWNAGTIGYLSERRVVNLDGLVNSWQFWTKDRRDLCRYWQRSGITYLLDVFQDGEALSVVSTRPGYAGCSGDLRCIWSQGGYGARWRVECYRIGR